MKRSRRNVVVSDRLKKQMEFILEVDKLKNIYRQSYVSDGSRHEEDADHSWHLALMALLLSEHANSDIDVLKTIGMVLIHDIVEIDAGDTYAYDSKGNTTKREREEKAADRIFNILPGDQAVYLRELWEEFEAYETMEAKFAHVLDNAQPLMLNNATNGKAWREHQIKKSQVMKRNEKVNTGSESIWEFLEGIIEDNVKKGNLIDE
ncbi:MAG: HD domain-containing protein [Lachnospiraceae bacterium]|nr:HD domain-containing protein [Lachnospiraceae bacterium]